MRLSAKHRVLDNFIRAYRLHHGREPSISESKGYLWVDGRGGYLLEEVEEMTAALRRDASGSAAASISAGAH